MRRPIWSFGLAALSLIAIRLYVLGRNTGARQSPRSLRCLFVSSSYGITNDRHAGSSLYYVERDQIFCEQYNDSIWRDISSHRTQDDLKNDATGVVNEYVLYDTNSRSGQTHLDSLSIHYAVNVTMAQRRVPLFAFTSTFPNLELAQRDGCGAVAQHEYLIANLCCVWAYTHPTSLGLDKPAIQNRDDVRRHCFVEPKDCILAFFLDAVTQISDGIL